MCFAFFKNSPCSLIYWTLENLIWTTKNKMNIVVNFKVLKYKYSLIVLILHNCLNTISFHSFTIYPLFFYSTPVLNFNIFLCERGCCGVPGENLHFQISINRKSENLQGKCLPFLGHPLNSSPTAPFFNINSKHH